MSMRSNQSTPEFENAYSSLNTQQKKAVDSIEGPVLVIAGPGTGKTQILAARVARIIQQTDCVPENILCLTYTDAGSVAMRKRLLQFIGPDAYRVPIHTFHGFCNMVIQDNLDYFGVKGLDAVSELEQIAFVHQIIDGFGKGHPLKRWTGDVYYETGRLLSLYTAMKRENWSASFLRERAEVYLADLPNREEFVYKRATKNAKAGDLKLASIETEHKRMRELVAAAESFEQYQQLLAKQGRYDFDDMILWVIKAFQTSPDLLNTYREKFLYFLVDEYQDTNGSQNTLLELLIAFWEKPNIFCVGDDDQSIYRFQGANVENIAQFVTSFKPETITLDENYRSTQYILDAAKIVIGHNQQRINPDKTLIASHPETKLVQLKPAVVSYPNPQHEVLGIAQSILHLLAEGIPAEEIAVLYRKHNQAEELVKYLEASGVAVNIRKKQHILNEPFIQQLLTILRFLEAESRKPDTGDAFLFALLHFDYFENDIMEIAKIAMEQSKNYGESRKPWREVIRFKSKTQGDLFSGEVSNSLGRTSSLLEKWIRDCFNCTLQEVIENVISESGMLVKALSGEQRNWNLQLLHSFFDFVKSECAKRPKLSLSQLLQTLDLMESEGVELPAQRISFAQHGVHFISIHSSKGLEFDYVFMMGCTTKIWEKAVSMKSYKFPDTLFSIQSEDDAAESRRLFYVGLTRARKQLTVSYPMADLRGKDLEKSRFVAELEESTAVGQLLVNIPEDVMATYALKLFEPKPTIRMDLFDNEWVDDRLSKYSLSVTHLNQYLKCPTSFYFNHLIRVPAPQNASMTFGSAVHHALEMLFKNMNQHPEKQFDSVDRFIQDFAWYMKRHEDSFTETELKRRLEYGQQILKAYYEKYIHDWNKVTSIERSYRNVVMRGVPLNGKLDKLEFDGNEVNVVDYKTGQYANAVSKFDRPDPQKYEAKKDTDDKHLFEYQYGGDYWRQAVFYKILMDNDQNKTWVMRSTEFDFVEPEKETGDYKKEKVHITPQDIDLVSDQIVYAYESIKAKRFSEGCGKEDCMWCSFVKSYYKGKPDSSKLKGLLEDVDAD